ncbi:TPA: hypothetical protein L0163_000736 [Citrobacter freundii]|uniref:hypothetical protein n=1 Tax=Citrobacter freundii TaxID=546 RepID=UPI001A1E0C8A|nr:hypothetical protein [Salmonella enterica]WQC28513.1 hypothetical protein U0541_14125 [Citrobacter freundii]HAT4016703.1 hypothetical protein [Citrobacter freundii]HAT4019120.1 hypothetical protein [Citrobacter freundii]HAT4024196.1 hypothetical protein [Citrobacter freundii]
MKNIAFLYPSFPSEKDIADQNLGQPNLALKVKNFPKEFTFLAAIGLVNLDLEKNYSLSVNLYFNDGLVTDPDANDPSVSHKWNQSKEGGYVSTFGIPLTAHAEEPGVYTLKLFLYEKSDEDRILLDENESYLIISEGWAS